MEHLGMDKLGFTGTLARRTATHPWITVGTWVVLLAAAVLAMGGLGDVLTEEGGMTVPTESETAWDLIADARAAASGGDAADSQTEYVIVAPQDGGVVTDAAYQALLTDLATTLRGAENVVQVTSPSDGAPGLVTADGRYAMLQVTLAGPGETSEVVVDLVDRVAAADAAADGFRIVPVGEGSVNHEFTVLAEETLAKGETLGLPIALVVLLLVFGAVIAALLPLALAVVAIIGALGLTVAVGQAMDLSFFIVSMITMIGLAVGIDYSLFIVQRFREERLHGRPKLDAVTIAGSTAARAVFFSGMTVIIALLGLMFMPETTMRSLGIGAILAVAATLFASLTLLPAVLGLLGDRVNRLRVPGMHRERTDSHRFWNRITATVTRRPLVSVALAGGLLVTMALPYVSLHMGSNYIASLPEDSDVRYGFEVLSSEFQGGIVETPIAISGDVTDPAVQAATDALVGVVEADDAFTHVTVEPLADDLLVVTATSLLDPSTIEAREAIERLRTEVIPAAFAATDAEVRVTGDAAFIRDMIGVVQDNTPRIFAFVLGLSFVLLMMVFRSIVVPLKAIVMNLLSVGAAYGLVTAVFQWGWGADLLGLQQTEVIESWVPLFLFAVLFGLSMDYHVFLLSRIKERYDRTRDNSGSVAFGLSATGAIITGAAAIMVAVFGGFAAGDLVMFQQMGFGLAAAVILDATIVRSVLVPATMELLGDRNWYLPSWLQWLPELHVEGPAPVAAPADVIVVPDEEPARVPEQPTRTPIQG